MRLAPAAEPAPLESERFGIACARCRPAGAEEAAAAVAEARSLGIRLLIARCQAADLAAVHALEGLGGRLMDTLVYSERDLQQRPPEPGRAADPRVHELRPGEAAAVASIAADAFAGYTGHFHADPRLDRSACDATYADWAARSCASVGPNTPVLVAESGGRPAAFASLRLHPDGRCELVLTAVAGWARRQGLFSALAFAAMLWSREHGGRTLFSSTQLPNLAVQKAWSRLGMEPSAAHHTLHLWL